MEHKESVRSVTFWHSLNPSLRFILNPLLPASELEQIALQTYDNTRDNKYRALEQLLQKHISETPSLGLDSAFLFALGFIQMDLETYNAAENNFRSCLSLRGGHCFPSRSNIGFVLNKQGKHAEAEEVFGKLLPELQDAYGQEAPAALGCMRQLMEASLDQGKIQQAKVLNQVGLRIVDAMGGKYKADEIEAMQALKWVIDERLSRFNMYG